MSISIRTIATDDFDQWRPLWEGYNAFYGRSGDTALPEPVTQNLWRRLFDAGSPVFALVAVDGSRVVGIAHYMFHDSTSAITPSCYLQDLFTAQDARRLGVGRALIEAVYAQAEMVGAGRVYWQTHETNLTAQRLYDKVAKRSGFLVYRHLV